MFRVTPPQKATAEAETLDQITMSHSVDRDRDIRQRTKNQMVTITQPKYGSSLVTSIISSRLLIVRGQC